MDEPLSNLDAQLRAQMRIELKRLQRELRVTTLYVTHDQVEAMTMADLIVVMRDGRLQQVGTPAQIYGRPANLFVATFCGSPPMNILDGDIADGVFRHESGVISLSAGVRPGRARLGFRPEHASLVERGRPGALTGEIYVLEPLGNETLVTVKAADSLINLRAPSGFERPIGDPCGVQPEPGHLHLFDVETGAALDEGSATEVAATGATA
jgi:multiple sugar transport system ATP-binding protein